MRIVIGRMSTDNQESVQGLDIRDVDTEPFEQVMSALDSVSESEALRLVYSFEPVPLYDILNKRGYQYDTEQVANRE